MSTTSKNDEKSDDTKSNEDISIDNSLLTQIETMNNDDIGNKLFKYILKDEINEFNAFIKYLDIVVNTNKNKNELDLKYILNNALFEDDNKKRPLLVVAANKNNLDIVNTLIEYGVCLNFYDFICLLFCKLYQIYKLIITNIGRCKCNR